MSFATNELTNKDCHDALLSLYTSRCRLRHGLAPPAAYAREFYNARLQKKTFIATILSRFKFKTDGAQCSSDVKFRFR